mmetsp:Transcript_15546/g.20243  ORF Transcript_15546/g.20243 Transcript_15546/m.20243 type:complete len:200 (+) Transcript_15546:81-680(+)
MLNVRQNGTRHQGCDESSGWIWHAARVLDEYLALNWDVKGLSIIELGAGTGWLALQLALRGAKVTATDRAGALPLLIQNIVSNQEHLASDMKELDIEVVDLEWGDDSTNVVNVLPGKWDLIVGSDIVYLVEHYQALLEMIARHDFKQCILVYEERRPVEESTFIEMARVFGFELDIQTDKINPTTGKPISILRMTYIKT